MECIENGKYTSIVFANSLSQNFSDRSRPMEEKCLKQKWVNVYFRPLIPPTVILNIAKLALITNNNIEGLPYLVSLSPLAE